MWNSYIADRLSDIISICGIGTISDEDRKGLIDTIFERKKAILDFINPFRKQAEANEKTLEEQQKKDDEVREETIKRLGANPFSSLNDILKSLNAVADETGSNI